MLKPSLKHWRKLIIILGIIVPISFFIGYTDFDLVQRELSAIGFNFIILLLSTFVAYLLGTLGWWVCLGDQRHVIKIRQLFAVRQIGETVGIYNPTSIVGGDLLKTKLLTSYGISKFKASESVAISRLTAILSQFSLLLLATSWLLILRHNKIPITITVSIIFLILLLLAACILTIQLLNKNTVQKPTTLTNKRKLIGKLQVQIRNLISQCQHFYQHQKKAFWISFFIFLLHWIAGSIEFYLILRLIGYDVTIMHGILMDMGVIIVKSVAGFIPGQLGIEELANKLVLLAVEIGTGSLWLTVSILRRIRQLFWIAFSAILYLTIPRATKNNISIDGNSIC